MAAATLDPDFLGDTRFAIVRRLGQGGMGVVYEALDVRQGRAVALKTLLRMDAAAIYRFKKEFRALAEVSHRNLVSLHELIGDEDRLFFTMDLVPGVDLLHHLRGDPAAVDATMTPDQVGAEGTAQGVRVLVNTTAPPVPGAAPDPERLRAVMLQLAEGISALHAAGKMHRDLKPSNVLVTPEGLVKILDFGLVSDWTRGARDAMTEGTVMGTPAYMAPEQAAGLRARPASDWYAFGVILYEALTGALPFSGTPIQIIFRKQQDDPPPPRSVARGVPDDLNDLCLALLRRDPEARPAADEILHRLGGAPAAPAAREAAEPSRFVGRAPRAPPPHPGPRATRGAATPCSRSCRAARGWARARSSSASSTTSAATSWCSRAAATSGRVCRTRRSTASSTASRRTSSSSPHAEVRGLLPRDAGALARLFPVLRRIDGIPRDEGVRDDHERLARAYGALRDLLAAIARKAPLVLTIDDLQWGDADSTRLLAAVLAPPGPAVLVIGTCRSEDVAKVNAIAGLAAFTIDLSPFTASETEELARALLPSDAAAPERARAISREAGGVPFFVSELARFAGAVPAGREPSIDGLVAHRLARLPAEARRLLELCAVAGRPTPQQALLDAMDDVPEAPAALRLLRAEGLIRSDGVRGTDAVETYHDRIREHAVRALAPAALRELHGRLAATLERWGADAEVLAWHHLGAGDRERAAELVLVAARKAAGTLAFHRAAHLYAQRIGLDEARGAAPGDVAPLRIELGHALEQCGRGPEAARAYELAAQHAAPDVARDLRRRAAEQLLISGHVEEGLAALDGVLREVGMKIQASPKTALVSFLARAAQLRLRGLGFKERAEAEIDPADLARLDTCFTAASGLTFADPIRAADFQVQHLLLALRAGEPSRIALGLANHAALVSADGGGVRERVAGLLEITTSLATRIDHPRALGRARMATGTAAFFQGRFRDAVEILDDAERILRERCAGVAWELDGTQLWARTSLVFLGDLHELEGRAVAQLADARARGDRLAVTWIEASAFPQRSLRVDDPAGARRYIHGAVRHWSPRPGAPAGGGAFLAIHYLALWHEVLVDLYEGAGVGALARLTERWAAVDGSLLLRMQICRVLLVCLRGVAALAAAGGDPRSAHLAAAERDARSVAGERMPYARGDGGDAACRGRRHARAAAGGGRVAARGHRAVRWERDGAVGCQRAAQARRAWHRGGRRCGAPGGRPGGVCGPGDQAAGSVVRDAGAGVPRGIGGDPNRHTHSLRTFLWRQKKVWPSATRYGPEATRYGCRRADLRERIRRQRPQPLRQRPPDVRHQIRLRVDRIDVRRQRPQLALHAAGRALDAPVCKRGGEQGDGLVREAERRVDGEDGHVGPEGAEALEEGADLLLADVLGGRGFQLQHHEPALAGGDDVEVAADPGRVELDARHRVEREMGA